MTGRPRDMFYWRRGDDYAIREGDWKLAWNDERGPKTIRLFNLADDPEEHNDLASGQIERAQMFQDLFDAWDSALPESMTGIANPRNRNKEFETGHRIDVAGLTTSDSTAKNAGRPPKEYLGHPFTDKMGRQAVIYCSRPRLIITRSVSEDVTHCLA